MLQLVDFGGHTVFIRPKAITAVVPPNANLQFPTGAVIYGAEVQGLSVDLAGFVARLGGTPRMIELTDLRDRSFWLSAEAVTTVQVPPAGTAGAALAICGGHPYLARQSPDAIALLVG